MENAAVCCVAYRVNIDRLGSGRFTRLSHTYEEIDDPLTRRYSLVGMPIDREIVQQLKAHHEEKKVPVEVWVTPELPFILFISLGIVVGCFLGV